MRNGLCVRVSAWGGHQLFTDIYDVSQKFGTVLCHCYNRGWYETALTPGRDVPRARLNIVPPYLLTAFPRRPRLGPL